MSIRLSLKGDKPLAGKLKRLKGVNFDAVVIKNVTQMYSRGKEEGGTPVDSGELRISLGMAIKGKDSEVGYTKDYAPHVEYGHRTKNGGYVQGQRYFKRNVDKQKPIFRKDILNQVRRA